MLNTVAQVIPTFWRRLCCCILHFKKLKLREITDLPHGLKSGLKPKFVHPEAIHFFILYPYKCRKNFNTKNQDRHCLLCCLGHTSVITSEMFWEESYVEGDSAAGHRCALVRRSQNGRFVWVDFTIYTPPPPHTHTLPTQIIKYLREVLAALQSLVDKKNKFHLGSSLS